MPKAMLNVDKCQPEQCANGVCAARKDCPTKAIYQEEPLDMPVIDPFRCRGCTKCMNGCPMRAFYFV